MRVVNNFKSSNILKLIFDFVFEDDVFFNIFRYLEVVYLEVAYLVYFSK